MASVGVNFLIETGRRALFLIGFSALVLLQGCDYADEEKKLSGATMGTTYHITLVNPSSEVNVVDLQKNIDTQLAALNAVFSTYDDKSELSLLNKAAINEWIQVSPALFAVIEMAKQISEQSDGAYDVTVGPLVELWGFGKREAIDGALPDSQLIQQAKAKVCNACIEMDVVGSRIRKTANIEIDLSSIAKGYAVDRVADTVQQHQIENFMVEVGGEVVARGVNRDAKEWRLGIESPVVSLPGTQGDKVQQVIEVSGKGVATSGDYRNFMVFNGKQYSHIINPVTGYPVEHSPASVTVIADSCALADAWATAFTVLGVEKGMEIAKAQSIAVYFMTKNKDQSLSASMTDTFKPFLVAN